MEPVETLTYVPAAGWSGAARSPKDAAGTLVCASGESSLLDDEQPLREPRARFPSAVVLGCSTAGAATCTIRP